MYLRFIQRFLEHSDGKAPQACDVFGAEAAADTAAILVEVPVEHVMHGLDAPVAAIDGQQALRRGLAWGAAGQAEGDFTRAFAAALVYDLALDAKDLGHMREVEIVVEFCAAPDAASLDAAVCDVGFDEIGRRSISKQQGDVPFERGLIALDGEMVMRARPDEKRRPCPRGEQGVGRDILARDRAAL